MQPANKLTRQVCAWGALGIFAALFTASTSAAPPVETTGMVRGEVVDRRTSNALVGAVVRVAGTQLAATTGTGGKFLLRDVPVGVQVIDVGYLGFASLSQRVTIVQGEPLHVRLEIGDAIETMVVTASATGRARALNIQKNEMNLVNVVSADAIGNFPDQNVAEALSRVAGVSIQRDRGEGRYVNVRGVDSELNAYSIDGMALAAPRSDERAVLLDIIPSDLVERLEVSKTILPNQPGDAIGGAINIRSPSAFDYGGRLARATLKSNYSELSDEWAPHFAGALGGVFGEAGNVAALVGVSLDERRLAADALWTDPWELADDPAGSGEYFLPGRLSVQRYDFKRTRKGAIANLEYATDDGNIYFVRGNYSEFADDAARHRSRIELDEDGLVAISDTSAIVDVGDEPSLGRTEIVQDVRLRSETLSVWGVSTGGENRWENTTIDYQAGYSFADEDNKQRLAIEYLLQDATQVAYVDGGSLNPNIGFTGEGVDATDGANYVFNDADDTPELVEEDHWEFALNMRQDFGSADTAFAKMGFRARLTEKRADLEKLVATANPPSVDTLDAVTIGHGPNAFATGMPLIDPEIQSVFERQRAEFVFERDFVGSTSGDWKSSEDVLGGYVMGGYSIDRFELIGGLRFEHTAFASRGFLVDEGTETATAISDRNEYDDWLPGLHLRYAATDDLVVRAAYTQTIARPGFEQSAAASVIDGDEIERGNPKLERARSRNYDVAAELYLPASLGMISVAGFYKDVEGFLFGRISEETLGGERFEVTSYDNGKSGRIYGVEFGYQQEFHFLPPPFDGLGVYGNVVVVRSKATLPSSVDRTDAADLRISFPRQSDLVGNLAITYEKGPLFLRAAATYRGKYLESVGDEPHEDRFYGRHIQWDLSSRYRISDRWSVIANVVNANDEPLGGRFGRSNRTVRYENYSWSAQIGVRFVL